MLNRIKSRKIIYDKSVILALGNNRIDDNEIFVWGCEHKRWRHPLSLPVWCDSSGDFSIYCFKQVFSVNLMFELYRMDRSYIINSLYAPFLADIL